MNPNTLKKKLEQFKEIIITNLIMVAEIPSPMENDSKEKGTLVAKRLSNYDLLDISIDEAGNIVAILPGTSKDLSKNIVLIAHMDTLHPASLDHTVRIEPDKAIGTGLVDNSLGVAALVSLPYILKHIDLELEHNIVLCFSHSSLGRSDLKSTRFFIENFKHPINYGICVEGYPLGRISYQSLGILRQQVSIHIPEEYDWTRFGTANAIVELNKLMNDILEIPVPNKPKTTISFNSIHGGQISTATSVPSVLNFEIRSESNDLVNDIDNKIQGLIKEQTSKSGAQIITQIISRRNTGGLHYMHPLVQALVKVLDDMSIPPRFTPSTSDLSAFIDANIPAVTIGLTNCEKYNQDREIMDIQPIYSGIAQLLTLIFNIDQGHKNDQHRQMD